MPQSVVCEECFTAIDVSAQMAGRTMRCPHCGNSFRVSLPEQPSRDRVKQDTQRRPSSDRRRPSLQESKPESPEQRPSPFQTTSSAHSLPSRRSVARAAHWGMLFFVLCAVLTLTGAGWEIYQGRQTLAWPKAFARITRCRPGVNFSFDDSLKFAYTYRVGEEVYESTRISRSWFSRSNMINKYHENQYLPVYYNPHDPAESLLEPGIPRANVLIYALCALLMMTVALYLGFVR